MGEAMTKNVVRSEEKQAGAAAIGRAGVDAVPSRAGLLPDAPLAMPPQVIERPARFGHALRNLFSGDSRSFGA